MSESLRPEPLNSPEAPGVEHDAKTEDFLLTGLDHYFAGDYQQAINVWTRVLFLDRGHARARAYIERARSALAEQQRESEELLHNSVAALDRGDVDLARRLLISSVDRGGPQELALPVFARLDRLEAALSAVESAQRPGSGKPGPGKTAGPVAERSNYWGLVAAVIAAFAVTAFLLRDGVALLSFPRGDSSSGLTLRRPDDRAVPLAQPGEIALKRARRLFATGHPLDALRVLDSIRSTDPVRGDADRLRGDIQRELLRFATPAAASAGRR